MDDIKSEQDALTTESKSIWKKILLPLLRNVLAFIGAAMLLKEFFAWVIPYFIIDYRVTITPGEFKYSNNRVLLSYTIKNESASSINIYSHKLYSQYDKTIHKNEYSLADNYKLLEHDSKNIVESIPVIYWHPYTLNDSIYRAALKNDSILSTLTISIILNAEMGSTTHRDTISLGQIFIFTDPEKTHSKPVLHSTYVFYD